MSKYTLLTGATGLLGSFLLKDLLQADVPVVALVRASRMETATERIEGILRRFERRLGRPLPRPVVMEANLHESELGLSLAQKSWLSRHADSILHNAASLNFVASEDGEPYKTNIDGTRNVLELCRATGIRRFFHVSTAYVCGKRKGTILESDLTDAFGFGNDYEKSKFAAETMVRTSDFLDSATILRPAIIVGDSTNGYTSTYHGFYAPMKILVPLLDPRALDHKKANVFGDVFGLKQTDRKNFVPVDWVSRVSTAIVLDRRLHDSCYHLTAANRVSIETMSRLISEGVEKYKKPEKASSFSGDLQTLLPLFNRQMSVYQAYASDDPEFDMSNVRRAVPQYPPMEMTNELMNVLIRFAIESRFGWPKPKPTRLDFVSSAVFSNSVANFHGFERDVPNDAATRFGLRISGSGGGDWMFGATDDGRIFVSYGLPDDAPLATMNVETFRSLVSGSALDAIRDCVSWEHAPIERLDVALAVVRGAVCRLNSDHGSRLVSEKTEEINR